MGFVMHVTFITLITIGRSIHEQDGYRMKTGRISRQGIHLGLLSLLPVTSYAAFSIIYVQFKKIAPTVAAAVVMSSSV